MIMTCAVLCRMVTISHTNTRDAVFGVGFVSVPSFCKRHKGTASTTNTAIHMHFLIIYSDRMQTFIRRETQLFVWVTRRKNGQ